MLSAKQCLEESFDIMSKYFNRLRQEIKEGTIKVGSKVWLDGKYLKVVDVSGNLKTRKSLDYRRLGPYEVTEVLGNGTAYRLKLPEYQKFHDVQSISRLELVKDSVEFPEAHVETPYLPVIRNEVEEFEIEKIVRHKTVHGKRQFLVKYLGYDSSFNQWRHRSELANCMELLEEYELKHNMVGGTVRRSPRLALEKSGRSAVVCVCNGPLILGCTCGYYL